MLVKVYGLDTAKQMIPCRARIAGHVTGCAGYTGAPSLHRGNRGYITLFVNRRWFQDTSVAYAVIQAYHTLLPVGRYPVAVIFLEIDPGDVDVNVHPTKAEVRFRDPSAIFGAVQQAVRRALVEHAPIPETGSGGDRLFPRPGRTKATGRRAWMAGPGDRGLRRTAAPLRAGPIVATPS